MTHTAFHGIAKVASGSLAELAVRAKHADEPHSILIFDDATGRVVDVDTRGSDEDVRERYLPAPGEQRGRGRPKLGVVAREVTLLPRHWDWLNAQPGGASVALRKLVDEARRARGDRDRTRQAQEAAYRFMSATAGNFPGFEEATRALFAHDRRKFGEYIAGWPEDIRDYAVKLAFADLETGGK